METTNKNMKLILDEDSCILLYMMHLALLEIRASHDITVCRGLAGVFHNVPIRILGEMDSAEIYDGISETANRVGVSESFLENFKENALRGIEKLQKEK